jgi:hypothetical protein
VRISEVDSMSPAPVNAPALVIRNLSVASAEVLVEKTIAVEFTVALKVSSASACIHPLLLSQYQ